MDMARGLNARVADAERIKTFYGSVLVGGSDERDMITVPPIGDDERDHAQFVPRSTLVRIIKPRVEEILEMVRDRLAASPFAAEAARPRRSSPAAPVSLPDCRSSPRIFSAARCASAGRSALPACRKRRKGRPLRSAAGLLVYPQAGASRTFRNAQKRHLMTGTRRLFRPRRTMASESF